MVDAHSDFLRFLSTQETEMTRLTASALNEGGEYARILLARLLDRSEQGLRILGAKPEILITYGKSKSTKGKSVRFDVVCLYHADDDPTVRMLIVEGKLGARQNDYDGMTQTELYNKVCGNETLLRETARQVLPDLSDGTPLDWRGTLLTLVTEPDEMTFGFTQHRFADLDPDGRLAALAEHGSLDQRLLCGMIDLYRHDVAGRWLTRINEAWRDGTPALFADTLDSLQAEQRLDDKTRGMLERLCIHTYGMRAETLLGRYLNDRPSETAGQDEPNRKWSVDDARDQKSFQMYVSLLHGAWVVEKLPGNPNVGMVSLKMIVESQLVRASGKARLSIQLDSGALSEQAAPALKGVDMADYKPAGKMNAAEWKAYLDWQHAVYPPLRKALSDRLVDMLSDGNERDPHAWTLKPNDRLAGTNPDKRGNRVAQVAALEFNPGGNPHWTDEPYDKVMRLLAGDINRIGDALASIIADVWPDRESSWTK